MTLSKQDFLGALASFPSGVTVVTGRIPPQMVENGTSPLVGMTVSAFSSLSLDPPLILVCLGSGGWGMSAFSQGMHFAVNMLSDQQQTLSDRFATPHIDRFADVDFHENEHAIPVLGGCTANLACVVHDVLAGGDHAIVVGQVEQAVFDETRTPLVHFRRGYCEVKPV